MPSRHLVFRPTPQPGDTARLLVERFAAVREEFDVPDAFPPDVVAEARGAADAATLPERDETAVRFVTVDPPGSMDLDQAMAIERSGEGFRVRYAIADVPAFVRPGGALDEEARRRGQTVYCPDERVPLYPPELSEGAASLLPEQVRPAFVWDLELDASGELTRTSLYRAMVRSTARYDYEHVQRAVDDGSAEETLLLLREVGTRRIELERRRGGASLPLPEQEVEEGPDGSFTVSFRPLLPAEDWNAQLSLLTGMAAASLMLDGKVGVLRTMPAPEPRDLERFRRQVAAAGVPWPEDTSYGELLRTLDRTDPRHLALIHEATSLFRGAAYTAFDGEAPEQASHAAVAAPYTHVTAPLRRLVDRFGLVVCEALCSGTAVPGWAREALPTLPEIMAASDRRTNGVERACTDAVEAAELVSRVGQQLGAVVVDANGDGVTVQLDDVAVVTKAKGSAEPGTRVQVRVDSADVSTGRVTLTVV